MINSKATNANTPYSRRFWYYLLTISCLLGSLQIQSQCMGGQILAGNGTDKTSICLEDAQADGLNVYNTSFAPTNYAYVITDINNQILSIGNSANLRFENLIEGSYYIYGFSYQGEISANLGDYIYTSIFASGCWQISYNRVEVLLASPKMSEIRTEDFQTSKNLCLNQGDPDFVSFQNITEKNTPYVFLITDSEDRIIEVNNKSFADFSNTSAGDSKIYGLAYTGQLLASYGMLVTETLSSGCFELSNNVIDVNRAKVDGGNIFTQDFQSFYEITADDGQSNRLNLISTGSVQAEYTYFLTDGLNNVIERLTEPSFDFEGIAAGTYRIWGYSYSGNILPGGGRSIFNTPLADGCFSRSFNAITITVIHEGVGPTPCEISATTIGALNGTTFCQNGATENIFTDADMSQGVESALILIDDSNIITRISQASEIDVDALSAGSYSIIQIVYEELGGLFIGGNVSSLSGCFAQSNAINIEVLSADNPNCISDEECPLESSILTVDQKTVCVEDLDNNIIIFDISNVGPAEMGILITDINGVIVQLSADNIFEITDVGTRIYYHINYEPTVEIFGGESIDLLEGCFALSNGIVITGIDNCFTEPCMISPASISTSDATNLCANDAMDDIVNITSSGGTGDEQIYILVDSNSDEIITSNSTGQFEFTENLLGNFEIYLLDYDQPFALENNVSALEGCFVLSAPILISNSDDNCIIEPIDCLNDGGQIVYNGPIGICGSDGQNDIINIEVPINGGSNRVFLLVDEVGTIINVAPALVVFGDPFPSGIYEIYALSYEDFPVGLFANENLANFSNLCLSNSIQISVSDDFCEGAGVRGGEVSNEFGEDEIKLCTDIAEEVFTINLDNSGSTAFDYTYIETDQNNIITRILDGSSVMYTADPTERMNSKIWGVSYSGSFAAFVGEDITTVSLSDDSFNLSDNFIQVEISVVIGENPEIVGAEGPFLEIISGQEFVVDLVPTMSSFLDYETAYILFDLDAVTIIDILYPDENFQITLPSLEATPLTGELLTLTAIAYTGNILLEPGGQADDAFLPNASNVTDGCFDVSSINIAVRVFDEDGGEMPLDNPDLNDFDFNNVNNEEISLHPNPVSEMMEVTFPQSFIDQKVALNIYSMSGELILKMNFEKAPTVELIDVSIFSVGTYTLQAYTNSSARTIQFLKI